jgi:peptidoglycan/LPS O-acetylase OafA/YrhL
LTAVHLTPPRLCHVDGLRGIAALWVVLFHLSEGGHVNDLKAALPEIVNQSVFDAGHFGVTLFFVVSGYVIAMVSAPLQLDFQRGGQFFLKRVIRLTLPYYSAVLLSAFIILVKLRVLNQSGPEVSLGTIAAHLFYAQGLFSVANFNAVFWTLCVEIQFYLFYIFLVISSGLIAKRTSIATHESLTFSCVLLSGLLGLLWPAGIVSTPLWPGSFLEFWYAFACGAVTFGLQKNMREFRVSAALLFVLLLIIVVVKASIFAMLVLLTSVVLWGAPKAKLLSKALGSPPLKFLGLISFSLYLFHNQITGSASRVFRKIVSNSVVGDSLMLVVIVSFCIFLSWIAYLLLEKPSIAWSKKIKI